MPLQPRDPSDPSDPPSLQAAHRHEFHYPSVDPGFPALDVDALLRGQQPLIDRIKLCFGMDRETFDQTIIPLLNRYATYVHLLPCTPDNYFNEPGGLLQIGLETAFYALQGTDAHIFSGRATISERTLLEPRWRHATFIAGLCAELHRPLSQVIVTDHAGHEWSPYVESLTAWLRTRSIERYFLKWRPQAYDSRALGLFALSHVVDQDRLQALATADAPIVPHLLATIAGIQLHREHNALEVLVRRALALVIDRFLLASAERYGKPQLGSHLERYLIDALRRLVAAGTNWTPNAEKSRVWFSIDGMFLAWPGAAEDVRKLLEADQLPGIPKAPQTILDILLNAGVFVPREDGSAGWLLHPPGGKPPLEAVKLSSPGVLFAELDKLPAALPTSLLTPPKSSEPGSPPPGAATATRASPAPMLSPSQRIRSSASKATTSMQLPLPGTTDSEPDSGKAENAPPSSSQPSTSPLPPVPGSDCSSDPQAQPTQPPEEPEAPRPSSLSPRLLAPLRLTPMVKEALQDMVATLVLEECHWAVHPMEGGLFVPLSALTSRKLDPPAALRALQDADMLGRPATTTRVIDGQEVPGYLIAERFVQDLPRQP